MARRVTDPRKVLQDKTFGLCEITQPLEVGLELRKSLGRGTDPRKVSSPWKPAADPVATMKNVDGRSTDKEQVRKFS